MVLCLPFPLPDVVDGPCQTQLREIVSRLLDWTFGWPVNLVLLAQNAEVLSNEMTDLQQKAEDVRRRLQTDLAQPGQKEPTPQVVGWLQKVINLGAEVDEFRRAYYYRHSVLLSGFCLGQSAAQLLRRVRNLDDRKRIFEEEGARVVDRPPDADDLAKEIEQLTDMRDDLRRGLEVLETGNSQLHRTSQAGRWLERATAVLNTWRRGVFDVDLLREVRNLKEERALIPSEVVTRPLPGAVVAVPSSSSTSSLVGRVWTLMEIRFYLFNPNINIVGICGPGGVGKTALMKAINNEYDKARRNDDRLPFDVVILITVSRSMNRLQIQRDIGKRVGLNLKEDGPSDAAQRDRLLREQAEDLHRILSKKRFLLLLDDVWEELDLEKVGIPHPDVDDYYHQSKIVFVTRDEELCNNMLSLCANEAARAKVTVGFLSSTDARELFWRNCGDRDQVLADRRIQPLAEKVIQQCGGLPLALLTMGKAMNKPRKTMPQLWEDTIRKLEYSPKEIPGMEKNVFPTLMFSYDALENETLRQCLLYCSLFPESRDIHRKQLIEYWVGEGLVSIQDDGDDTISVLRNRGQDLVDRLQSAHLLERGIEDEENKVRLHDIVRDMALWLTSKEAGAEAATRFINLAGRELEEVPRTRNWADATRVSLLRNKMKTLPDDVPECPMLTTLLAGDQQLDPDSMPGQYEPMTYDPPNTLPSPPGVNSVKGLLRPTEYFSIPPEFFHRFTGALRVLDLSNTLIVQIPPTIGCLGELELLRLSSTMVRRLPEEVGNLTKLRQLDLSYTELLEEVPQEAISSLRMLQVLNMYESNYGWPWGLYRAGHERGMPASLRCLEGLRHLDELGIYLRTLLPLRRLALSRRLSKSTRFLKISVEHLTASDLSEALKSLTALQELHLAKCPTLEQLEFINGQPEDLEVLQLCSLDSLSRVGGNGLPPLGNLRRLYIFACPVLRDIAWFGTLPLLQELHLYACEAIEELLPPTGPCGDAAFPRLRELHLTDLPRLRCICRRPLCFAFLQMIEVHRCPELRKLSLLPHGGMRIEQVYGAQEWWDALEWESDDDGKLSKPWFTPQTQRFIIGEKVMMRMKDGGRELTLYPRLR